MRQLQEVRHKYSYDRQWIPIVLNKQPRRSLVSGRVKPFSAGRRTVGEILSYIDKLQIDIGCATYLKYLVNLRKSGQPPEMSSINASQTAAIAESLVREEGCRLPIDNHRHEHSLFAWWFLQRLERQPRL